MKSTFLIISSVALALALTFTFCGNQAPDVEAAASRVINSDPDTISTAATTDSIIFNLLSLRSDSKYSLQVSADSLSGGTTATCFLELNSDDAGSDWVTLQTIPIDGVTTRALKTGTVLKGTVRCLCSAASSTQSTAVRVDFAYGPNPN